MAKFSSTLDHVKIAAPCAADWDQMFSFEGERVRFCSQCNLNVYNLSSMTRSEAEALLHRTEGRLCVRFYRRSDGTVLTQNCPVGLRALKRRVAWVAQLLLGMLVSLLANIGLIKLADAVRLRPAAMTGMIALPVERQAEPSIEIVALPVMGKIGPGPLSSVTMGKMIRKERAFPQGSRASNLPKTKSNRPESK